MIVLSDYKDFIGVYEKYASRMVVFALSFLDNMATAEDVVQDVFLKLHGSQHTFESDAGLSAFLYKTVRNRAIDQLRSQKRTQLVKQKIKEEYSEEELLNDELDGELIYFLARSLNDLPKQSKKVIRLLYEEDLSYKEVAETLNISPSTVKGLRKFALDLLRKKMDNKKLLQLFLLSFRLLPSL
jgi:RNA polymerase sigma-70 factor (family 1)